MPKPPDEFANPNSKTNRENELRIEVEKGNVLFGAAVDLLVDLVNATAAVMANGSKSPTTCEVCIDRVPHQDPHRSCSCACHRARAFLAGLEG